MCLDSTLRKMSDNNFHGSGSAKGPKRTRISLHMIVKRHLPHDAVRGSQDQILEALGKVTHVRLDRENIGDMDLELFGNSVTNLYLQHNHIEKIENLEHMQNLTFLTMSSNKLRRIEGLSHLRKLVFLDLSFNFIKCLNTNELPKSIALLNLKANRCSESSDYRQCIIQALPRIRQLDEQEITNNERREAGLDVSSSEEEGDEDEEEAPGQTYKYPEEALDAMYTSKSAEMLLRSQDRMEEYAVEHQNKLLYLEDLREQTAKLTERGSGD